MVQGLSNRTFYTHPHRKKVYVVWRQGDANMSMRDDMMNLVFMGESLKASIHLTLSSPNDYEAQWTLAFITKDNHWPHWIQFKGDGPQDAIRKAMAFLMGQAPSPNQYHPEIQPDWFLAEDVAAKRQCNE